MKALVLGGCGFIGSHLVDNLIEAGHKVRVFDRSPELYRPPLANVEYRYGNFSDVPSLAKALEGIEVVYHLISTSLPSTSNLDPISDVNGNLINTLHLLQLMVQKNIKKIVYLSSGGTVYGMPKVLPIPENHPLQPTCSYGVVKVAIENYLLMFHRMYRLEYVILRASNPYGERQGHSGVQGVISTFIWKILAGKQIEIWGDGNVVRDFIYVGDLIDLCILAGQTKVNGVFNVGSGLGYSINEIVLAVADVIGEAVVPRYKSGRGFDVPHVILDVGNAGCIFNWYPKVTLQDGISRTWRWAKTQSFVD